ncbi:MAG: tRNA (N6-threonylcarbamoyladenosine(37)-N6)-methyltransferase TrmO [Ruminococcus sp.]|nr:tRNA (N6-threonylcarbamoyladenosine(37)-N6)-methyltransferase TrmO [Ruminococcus sp.]
MKIIARVKSHFPEKFGIPRQSGLTGLVSQIVFEPEYRVPEAFRGLEGYSHIWILWEFSGTERGEWSPTVRPPKLGGNKRMGVFATRSPFRPNPIGLSSVRLEKIDFTAPNAPVLYVSGADIMDGTPVYDVKPYLAYTDAHPEAAGGFSRPEDVLRVEFAPGQLEKVPEELRRGLIEALEQDPRPACQNSPERVYIMDFAGLEIKFTVNENLLTAVKISHKNK